MYIGLTTQHKMLNYQVNICLCFDIFICQNPATNGMKIFVFVVKIFFENILNEHYGQSESIKLKFMENHPKVVLWEYARVCFWCVSFSGTLKVQRMQVFVD